MIPNAPVYVSILPFCSSYACYCHSQRVTFASEVMAILFEVGMLVQLQGLEDRPEHNGLQGTLVQFSKGEQRWLIRMRDATTKLLRPSNFKLCDGADKVAQKGGRSAAASQQRAQAALERLKQRAVHGRKGTNRSRSRSGSAK